MKTVETKMKEIQVNRDIHIVSLFIFSDSDKISLAQLRKVASIKHDFGHIWENFQEQPLI